MRLTSVSLNWRRRNQMAKLDGAVHYVIYGNNAIIGPYYKIIPHNPMVAYEVWQCKKDLLKPLCVDKNSNLKETKQSRT